MTLYVCVQDPRRAAQQALGGRRQVNRTRPSSARSGRHPRLCRLHHGVRCQRPPAGAQSGAGIAWHPWQVCAPNPTPLLTLSPSSPSSSHLSIFSNLLDSRCGTSVHTLKPSWEFLKRCFFLIQMEDFWRGKPIAEFRRIFFSFLSHWWIVRTDLLIC